MAPNSQPLDISRDPPALVITAIPPTDVKPKVKQGSISMSNVKIIAEEDDLCSLFAYVCSKKCLLFKYILPAFLIIIIISLLEMANWAYSYAKSYDISEITPYLLYKLVVEPGPDLPGPFYSWFL